MKTRISWARMSSLVSAVLCGRFSLPASHQRKASRSRTDRIRDLGENGSSVVTERVANGSRWRPLYFAALHNYRLPLGDLVLDC